MPTAWVYACLHPCLYPHRLVPHLGRMDLLTVALRDSSSKVEMREREVEALELQLQTKVGKLAASLQESALKVELREREVDAIGRELVEAKEQVAHGRTPLFGGMFDRVFDGMFDGMLMECSIESSMHCMHARTRTLRLQAACGDGMGRSRRSLRGVGPWSYSRS